jgi:thiamine-phosphate pyrophosphorylase
MRDRTLEAADWLGWAETLAEAALKENPQVQILVNRRVDLALALGAQGVHLGFDALAVPDARGLLGKSMRIGCSTHGLAEIECAAKAGADYVHLAPIFDPFSKPAERASLGLEILASACQSGMPVIAQGGISAPRCPAVLAAGAAGIAVTGAILQADRPGRATALLRSALDSSG